MACLSAGRNSVQVLPARLFRNLLKGRLFCIALRVAGACHVTRSEAKLTGLWDVVCYERRACIPTCSVPCYTPGGC